jgi:hypothetical protein
MKQEFDMDRLPKVQHRHSGDFAGRSTAADTTPQQLARLMPPTQGFAMNRLERSVP